MTIRRCVWSEGVVYPQYVCGNSTVFETGNQPIQLNRISQWGFHTKVLQIQVKKAQVSVYVIAPRNVDVVGFETLLQRLADGDNTLPDWTEFQEMVHIQAGFPYTSKQQESMVNIWNDCADDTLWTLDREIFDALVEMLQKESTTKK